MEYRRTIVVDKDVANRIIQLLTVEPKNEIECYGENEVYIETAVFFDGYEMDIKLCGVRFEADISNLPWTEAVLFKNGREICCSEVSDDFFGKWELTDGEYNFVVNVIKEEIK